MGTSNRFDVAVIGGGPAGSVAAITLAAEGFSVILLEKDPFPREKLCGEFLSAEVVRTISELGLDESFRALRPNPITIFTLFPVGGGRFSSPLGFGAFGVKRGIFDGMLLDAARKAGVMIVQPAEVKTVESTLRGHLLSYASDGVNRTCESRWAVGAFGRSPAPMNHRSGFPPTTRTGFVGFKFHLPSRDLEFGRKEEIIIASGRGLYCGISHVDDDTITLCVLDQRRSGDPGPREKLTALIQTSPAFAQVRSPEFSSLVNGSPILGGGNLSFAPRRAIRNGLLMVGDAAGLIAPLAGEGIGIGMEQGLLLGRLFAEVRPEFDRREAFFRTYARESAGIFTRRQRLALACQRILLANPIQWAIPPILRLAPGLLPAAIRGTRKMAGFSASRLPPVALPTEHSTPP